MTINEIAALASELTGTAVDTACAVRAVPNGRHSTDAESISAIRKTVRIWLLLPFLVSLFKKIPPPFFTDLRQCNQIPM